MRISCQQEHNFEKKNIVEALEMLCCSTTDGLKIVCAAFGRHHVNLFCMRCAMWNKKQSEVETIEMHFGGFRQNSHWIKKWKKPFTDQLRWKCGNHNNISLSGKLNRLNFIPDSAKFEILDWLHCRPILMILHFFPECRIWRETMHCFACIVLTFLSAVTNFVILNQFWNWRMHVVLQPMQSHSFDNWNCSQDWGRVWDFPLSHGRVQNSPLKQGRVSGESHSTWKTCDIFLLVFKTLPWIRGEFWNSPLSQSRVQSTFWNSPPNSGESLELHSVWGLFWHHEQAPVAAGPAFFGAVCAFPFTLRLHTVCARFGHSYYSSCNSSPNRNVELQCEPPTRFDKINKCQCSIPRWSRGAKH